MGKATQRKKQTPTVPPQQPANTAVPSNNTGIVSMLNNLINFLYNHPGLCFTGGLLLTAGITSYISKNSGCDRFSLIKGNLTEANLLIFAENHNFKADTVQCLDELTIKKNIGKHTVLVESAPSNLVVNCEDFDITPHSDRTCIGWNDADHFNQVNLKMNEQIQATIYKDIKSWYITFGGSSKKCDDYLDYAIKHHISERDKIGHQHHFSLSDYADGTLKVYSKNEIQYLGQITTIKVMEEVQSLRLQGKSYQEIFSEKQDYLALKPPANNPSEIYRSSQEMINAISKQNEALARTLEKHNKGFTAVIGGKGHFMHFKGSRMPGVTQIHKKLEEFSDTNPYAILAMD